MITKYTTNNHTTYVNNEDACKSLITQNMISQDLNQTPKMHMVTKDVHKISRMNTTTYGSHKHNNAYKHTKC